MFVTASDFELIPYNIPNLDKVVNTFPCYVNARERESLLKLLGRQLYGSFINGLSELPSEWLSTETYTVGKEVCFGIDKWKSLVDDNIDKQPTEGLEWELVESANVWLKLRDGAQYEYAGKMYKWEGLVYLLKPYIFSRYVRHNISSFTGIGVVIPNAENSEVVNPTTMIVQSFNDYAAIAGVSRYENVGYLYGRFPYSWSNARESKDTLYGFLSANFIDYPEWDFTCPELMNIFGI